MWSVISCRSNVSSNRCSNVCSILVLFPSILPFSRSHSSRFFPSLYKTKADRQPFVIWSTLCSFFSTKAWHSEYSEYSEVPWRLWGIRRKGPGSRNGSGRPNRCFPGSWKVERCRKVRDHMKDKSAERSIVSTQRCRFAWRWMEQRYIKDHANKMPSNNLDVPLWSCTHGLPIKGRGGHSPEVLQALIDFDLQKLIIERIWLISGSLSSVNLKGQ